MLEGEQMPSDTDLERIKQELEAQQKPEMWRTSNGSWLPGDVDGDPVAHLPINAVPTGD